MANSSSQKGHSRVEVLLEIGWVQQIVTGIPLIRSMTISNAAIDVRSLHKYEGVKSKDMDGSGSQR
jgi:hypothetical protein